MVLHWNFEFGAFRLTNLIQTKQFTAVIQIASPIQPEDKGRLKMTLQAMKPDSESSAAWLSPIVCGPRRVAYLACGWFFLGMAILGALLPVLPTTPFLLLTSYFFLRSSSRLHRRLLDSRLFGPVLMNWEKYRGVSLRTKLTALSMIAVSIAASLVFGNLSKPLKCVLIVSGATGVVVVLRLPLIPQVTKVSVAEVEDGVIRKAA